MGTLDARLITTGEETVTSAARVRSDGCLRIGHALCSLITSFIHSLPKESVVMLSWALAFFIIAIIAAVFGFTGIAAGAAEIAKILFVVFVVLFLVSLVAGLLRRP